MEEKDKKQIEEETTEETKEETKEEKEKTNEDTSKNSQETSSSNDSDKSTETEDEKDELKTEKEQLEVLLKAIKAVEEEKRKKGQKRGPRESRKIIALEFGGAFHHNVYLNFIAFYMLNLTLIYSIVQIFNFGRFQNLETLLLYVAIYTVLETFFKAYILMNHIQFVLKTFGFIFYFGYLSLFYIIDVYIFPNSVGFMSETLFVVFVGMFVVFRYILTQLIKNIMLRMR
jgi:hypothetical protein